MRPLQRAALDRTTIENLDRCPGNVFGFDVALQSSNEEEPLLPHYDIRATTVAGEQVLRLLQMNLPLVLRMLGQFLSFFRILLRHPMSLHNLPIQSWHEAGGS